MGKNFCFVFFILLVFDSANLEFSSTWLRLRHLTLLKAQSWVSHRTFKYCICNIQLTKIKHCFRRAKYIVYKNVITFTFSSASPIGRRGKNRCFWSSSSHSLVQFKFYIFFVLWFPVAGIEMYHYYCSVWFFSKYRFCFGSIPISYSVQVRTCVLVV